MIPVLIDGAGMPGPGDLPPPLARLSRRNALFMRHESFRRDADELVTAIERALALDPDPAVERTLRLGHEVNGLAVDAAGLLLVTGSADGTARVLEVASGAERARFPHDDGVTAVAVSADGRLVAAGGADHTARVWGGRLGGRADPLRPRRGGHRRGPRRRRRAAGHRQLRPHGAGLGRGLGPPGARVNHDSMVAAVALTPDGRLLATGSADHTARVWDAGSGGEQTWVGHDAAVTAVALDPGGDLLATGGEDRAARVWEVASGRSGPGSATTAPSGRSPSAPTGAAGHRQRGPDGPGVGGLRGRAGPGHPRGRGDGRRLQPRRPPAGHRQPGRDRPDLGVAPVTAGPDKKLDIADGAEHTCRVSTALGGSHDS